MIDNILLLVAIVECGSISGASRQLGISIASVSERLTALEKAYETSLLRRTTRKSSLTEEGKLLVEFARRMIDDKNSVDETIRGFRGEVSGHIRFSAPRDFGCRLLPHLDAFLAIHPQVSAEINLTDSYVDLVEAGLDFAIWQGQLSDSTLIQRKLGYTRRVVCAAPAYLKARGVPNHPTDLKAHECLVMRSGPYLDNQWAFAINGEMFKVNVNGKRIINDSIRARSWCKDGHGIALKSYIDVKEDLSSGQLVPLLEKYSVGVIPIQIVYPGSKQSVRRVTCLIDYFCVALGAFGTVIESSRGLRSSPPPK